MSSITISDMQNFVENGPDIQISSNIGNVIELGEDLGDDLGASLLTNRISRPASQVSHTLEPINDIGIGLEPLESISFDIPSQLPEISINRESDFGFSNDQSSTGPSINLASTRNPEEEKKKKIELINKLNRLESKGYTLTKHFSMDNTLDEIQQEYDRLVDAKSLESSIRFQRQCLMGVVTGFEFLNGKFNPFDWQMEGWSESVHENVEDYDEVFEELYDKYKGRGNMPPEAKLMMSLVGSGFMFHMSNSFFRQKMSNVDPGDIFRSNPQLAKQFAAAAANQAGPGFGNFMGAAMGIPQTEQSNPGPFYQATSPVQMPPHMTASPQVQRREMKGPSGVDDILKTFQEVRASELENPISIPQVFNQQPVRQVVNEMSNYTDETLSQTDSLTSSGTTGRRGRRKAASVANSMTLNL
jgi:hypothetical protein